jgi:UDP-N-acetylglucosamine diphosphorylase/glucosamine-1-phosphate N-acetyltransferase
VKPFSNIAHGVIGPVCKVAGEIEKSVIQGYSNKQHDGFLGHSYLGEWCNLGAGTITSDLKNTYGHVRVTMPWLEEDTQRTFVGLLMGDHSKSAIGTRFTTGTVCGICCNIVADNFPPAYLPPFTWLKPTEQQVYEVNKALDVARAVTARRMVDLGPSTEALLRDQYRTTHG